jgi:acyl carrier protein
MPEGNDMTTTIDRLRVLLVKDYKVDPVTLLPDTPLEALGIDSLGVAELMFNIEDEFKVTIPDQPVALKTVSDVVDYIDGLIATQQGGPAATNVAALRTAPGR